MYPQQPPGPPGWGPGYAPPGYGAAPPGYGAPPPAPRKNNGFAPIAAVTVGVLGLFCVVGGVISVRAGRQEREQQRARARIERERFNALPPAGHLAAARNLLATDGGVSDSALASARDNLRAIPDDAGLSQEVTALNREIDRRAAENAAEAARAAVEADRLRNNMAPEASYVPDRQTTRTLREQYRSDRYTDHGRRVWPEGYQWIEMDSVSVSRSGNQYLARVPTRAPGTDDATRRAAAHMCAEAAATLWDLLPGQRHTVYVYGADGHTALAWTHTSGGWDGRPEGPGLATCEPPLPPAPREPDTPTAEAPAAGSFTGSGPNCRHGCPCGNSCIPCSHRCRH